MPGSLMPLLPAGVNGNVMTWFMHDGGSLPWNRMNEDGDKSSDSEQIQHVRHNIWSQGSEVHLHFLLCLRWILKVPCWNRDQSTYTRIMLPLRGEALPCVSVEAGSGPAPRWKRGMCYSGSLRSCASSSGPTASDGCWVEATECCCGKLPSLLES